MCSDAQKTRARFNGVSSTTVLVRDRISEVLATVRGAVGLFLIFGAGFIVLAVISLRSALDKGWNETFLLGNVPMPKLYGAGATNYDVFSLCIFVLVALVVAIVSRYLYYRKTIEALRKRGISDYDKDGKVDSFADDFLDEDFF